MMTGKSRLKYGTVSTLFPRSEERVVKRLNDDRVSPNEATLPLTCGDYSLRLRYAGRPSLRLRRKEDKKLKAISLGGMKKVLFLLVIVSFALRLIPRLP
jgi:hypothetical protein